MVIRWIRTGNANLAAGALDARIRSVVVEVRVLGPVELWDGSSVVELPRVERGVVAALAARAGARVPVDGLEEAVWPHQRPPSARKSLQGRIVRLRRALGATAILERDGGYLLDHGHVNVDAERVAGLVTEACEAIRDNEPDAAVGLLAEARAAFRGEPYEGVADTALPAGETAANARDDDAHEHLNAAMEIRQRRRSQRLTQPAVDGHLCTLQPEHSAGVTDAPTVGI